ncbi:MAG TPA: TIR domain-containing protein [Thermoanaerobaculia bacterium]
MRKQVRFFCSYAEKDSRLAGSLLDLLLPHLKASRKHEYVVWEFHKLLTGERWNERILEELAQCDFGLLFLSPEFLVSGYIKDVEIPALLKREGIIPVGLKPVDFRLQDLQTLDQYQLFRLRTATGRLQCFSQLRGADRDAFALELFRQIEGRLG